MTRVSFSGEEAKRYVQRHSGPQQASLARCLEHSCTFHGDVWPLGLWKYYLSSILLSSLSLFFFLYFFIRIRTLLVFKVPHCRKKWLMLTLGHAEITFIQSDQIRSSHRPLFWSQVSFQSLLDALMGLGLAHAPRGRTSIPSDGEH